VARSVAERAARAGSGLSAASIHWGMRGAAAKPVAVTERDRRLLALLHDLNYLSSSQMALLGWGGDSTCARRRLRLLHDRGLIDKFRPARAAGSYEWNYRLTVEGWRLIAERGMHAEDKQYKPADIHSIAYVEHDLQVNALVLDIAHRAWLGEGPLLDAMRSPGTDRAAERLIRARTRGQRTASLARGCSRASSTAARAKA
jgi:Replication-relaxation